MSKKKDWKSPTDYLIEAYTNKLINDYKQDDEKEQERQRQRALSSPSSSVSTNSPTSSRNSSQTAQTGSQTTPAERALYKMSGRKYTGASRDNIDDRRSGRYRTSRNERSTFANTDRGNTKKDEDSPDRLRNTVKGAGKQWLGGQLSGVGTYLQDKESIARGYNNLKAEDEKPQYNLRSREEAEKTNASRIRDARLKEGVDKSKAERDFTIDPNTFTQKTLRKGDSLIESGTADIEKAKEGANGFEKFLIDNGSQMLQWAGDAGLRAIPVVGQVLSIGSFMNRAGGMSAYQGRQEGMNAQQQYNYQMASALMEGISELTFQSIGALRYTYGKGAFSLADKMTNKVASGGIVQRLMKTEVGKSLVGNMARLGGGAIEEGLEEVETDLVEPVMKYLIKKSEDPMAEFEGWDLKQMGYDFLMGATMGGVLGSADVARGVSQDLKIVNSDAYNDGLATSLIKQASVQGRTDGNGRILPTNAEILAQQMQTQLDEGKRIEPVQIRMLQEAIGQSTMANEEQLTRKRTAEYDKAEKEGNLVTSLGTRKEAEGFSREAETVETRNFERAKEAIGETATDEEASAVARVITGTATSSDIDIVLTSPKLKVAVEQLANEGSTDIESNIQLPINNREARNTLEDITAVNRIANRNAILKETQSKYANDIEASVENITKSGKDLYASKVQDAQNIIGSADIYRDRFSRLYTDGNTKGADFETSYNRIIGSLDSDTLKTVFTRDFAQQIFDEGRKAIITGNAKESARSKAEQYANRKGGLTFENNNENLISSREKETLQKFAERVGIEINVVKTLAKESNGKALMSRDGKKRVVNGMYHNGVITIASDSQNKLITVAKHELTHHLKETSPEMYQKLEDFVFERWYHGNAEEMEDEIARYMRLYSGQGLDRDGVREEIIADASEAFFTDEGAIQDAISFSEKLGRAIHDGIKTMLDAFLGLQDADSRRMRGYGGFLKDLGILQEAERMWLEALEDTQQRKRTARGTVVAEDYVDASTQYTTSDEKHSIVENDEEIERLESEPTQKSYRAMALIDGKLYPPMATQVRGKDGKWELQQGADVGQWLKSDITTDHKMFNNKGQFILKKDNGDTIPASYNPYIHSSDTMLNDQFASAYKRPNIVVVEGDVPVNELKNGKRAEHDLDDGRHIKAKDPTGTIQWKAGVVQGKLTGTRTVYLTNHFKPTRIVPDSEVARNIQKMIAGTDVVIPYNVVTPSLRQELQKLGVKMGQSKQKGYQVDLNVKFSVTAEEDQAYLDAVNRGDMETAQRMVDEQAKRNGYDIKAYHGTNAQFTRFDPEKLGSKNFMAGSAYLGFFASASKETAESYTGLNSMDAMATVFSSQSKDYMEKIKSKYNYDEKQEELDKQREQFFENYRRENRYYEEVEDPIKELKQQFEQNRQIFVRKDGSDYFENFMKNFEDNHRTSLIYDWNTKHLNDMYRAWEETQAYKDNQELEQKIYKEWEQYEIKRRGYVPHVLDLYLKMEKPYVHDFKGEGRDTESFASRMAQAKEEGYDGCIFKNVEDGADIDDIYTVFSNTQLKSADPVTYDDDGNVIPLSKRFNENNEDIRWSVSEETETEKAINESMTMEQCRQMIQRCYNIGEIREWSDGEYKNGDEWIRAMGSEEVGMVAENDWSIQQKYLDKIDGILNEDFTVYDVLDAYLAGTLRGKEKSKPTRLDTSKGTGYKDSRFYSPQLVEDAVKALEVADQKMTSKNKAEVNKARAKVLLFAHNAGAEETLGLTRAELNKKLRSWSNYSSQARDISKRINANVAPENRWTGIENLSWLSRATVSNDELANLVKDIKGESSEYERSYIARTMLALDTHIDWTELSFEFRDIAIPDQRSVKGFYRDAERKIVVEHNRPNSLAHEMGHALDNKWGREISGTFGKGYALTNFTKASLNQIPNADVKNFANNFYLFLDEISDFCDIRNDYTGRNNEVFARFVDQFVRWAEKISTGRSAYSSFDYNDRFNQNHFIEFARLLQEKASLDARGLLNSSEDTSKFSVSDDEVLDRYIADRQKRIDDGEQMSFFGSLNETIPSKPKEKTKSEKFYDNVLKTISNIKKKGSWSGFEVKGLFLQYPEFNFIERLNNKADETAVSDFNAFLSSFDKIDDLRNYNWYFSAYEYNSQWKKANRSGKMKFNKLIENRIEEIMAGKAHGRNVGIEKRDYTPKEMRKLFNELNTDKELKELGKKVFDCIDKNFDVKFQGVANIEGFKHGQGGTLGQAGGRTVHLNIKYLNSEGYTDQQKASTILHESIHTVTVYALRNRNNYTMPKNIQDACDVIEDVFWQIKDDPLFKGEYGVSKGAEEMVAELANPIFREKLKRKNVFARVIEAIRNILGIEVEVGDRPNAFKEVNKALETLMSNADVVSFERYANKVSRDYNGKFSVSEEDENTPTAKEYQSTIAKLEEKVADLKGEFKRTDLKTADPKQTRIQAGRLLKRHDSNLSIQNDVVKAFNDIFKLYKKDGTKAFDEAYEIAQRTAVEVVNGIQVIHDEGADEYQAIKDYFKNLKGGIRITDEMKRNITDYGDFYRRYGRKLNLRNGETGNIDNVYMELAELFPMQFTEDYVNPADQLLHMADVLDSYAPYYETLDGASEEMQDYVVEIASDILETAYGLQTKKTFADKKYLEKQKAVQEAYRKAREEALASRDRALAKQAERYETKISYLKQKNKDFKEETRERAEKNRRIAQIAGIHKRLLEKLDTPKDTKHLPDGYAPLVSNVLSMFDFTTKGMEKWAERYGEPSKRYRYLDELRKRLADMSKEDSPIAESGFEVDPDIIEIIEELKADVADTDRLSDLDSATLEDIYTLFKAFEHQLNTFNKAFDENNRQTVIENRDNFISETRDKKTRKDKQGTIGWLQRQLETNNTTPEDFFHLIGGTPEKLYKSIRKGFDKHIMNVKSAMDYIQSVTEGKDVKKWSENVREYTTSFNETIKLTDAQLMSIYCLSKREQAQQHMYSENGGSGIVVVPQKVGKGLKAETLDRANVVVNSSDIQKWISQLSKEQIEVADRLQRYLSEDMSKLGNETSLKLYGYKKFTEKNYFPIQSSNDWLNSNFDFKGDSPVLKNTGMTKALNKHASNPIVIDDIFTVATKHISTMSLYNSLVPSLTDFQRFWNSKDKDHNTTVQKEFIRAYGEPAYKYVENFMGDLNGAYKRGFEVEGVDKLMSKYKQASIGLNLRVLFQQPTAVARAGAVMNPIYITKALGASTTTLKQNLKDMREHCPIALWKSWGFYNTDLARDMRSIMMDEKTLSDNFSKAYGIADDLTWSVIFKAVRYEVEAQNKNLEVGSDDYWEKVNERASEVFDRTQVVDSPFHRSQNMRAKDNLSKMVTAFMAEPTKTYNMLKTELTLAKREIQSGQKAQGIKRASRVVQVFVMNALLISASSAVIDALRGVGGSGDDDKDKNWFERFLAHWWTNTKDNINPLGLLPVFKDVQSVVQGYDVTRMDMQAIGRMVKSLQYMGEYIKEPENSKYTLKNEAHYFLQQSAYLVGLPLANIERDVRGVAFSIAEAVGYDDLFFEEAKFKYQVNDKTKSMWADMYLDAKYKGNTALAKKIKDYITSNDAVTEEYIEEREKKYKKENKSASQQHAYDSSIQTLEASPIWNTASEDNKEYYTGVLENISVGIENQSTEYVTKLAKNGLTNEQVILYKLALKKVDKPNKNGNLGGTPTNAEKEDAIRLLERYYNLTQAQKDTLMGK